MEPPTTPFALQTSFPPVIFSYCTKTDDGRGEQRMWQIANFLKKHGIASFNGKQVEVGEDWMQKWLGKMPEADVCLALISGPYFESGPCKEEIYKTAREKIRNKYVGQWKDDKKHGQGTYTWADGGKYVGQFKDNDMHGRGKHTLADGKVHHDGEWENNKPKGTWADGAKYVGEEKDGKAHGEGTMAWANGDKYVGQFKDGKQHGQGIYTWADGGKYVGQFKDDKMHGRGKHTFADGEVHHDGEWENGQPKK